MVRISIFGRQGCAKCDTTKSKIGHFIGRWALDHAVETVFHDMDTLDGRAEGAFYDALTVPLTVIEKEGQEIGRWDGDVPNSHAIRLLLEEEVNATAH